MVQWAIRSLHRRPQAGRGELRAERGTDDDLCDTSRNEYRCATVNAAAVKGRSPGGAAMSPPKPPKRQPRSPDATVLPEGDRRTPINSSALTASAAWLRTARTMGVSPTRSLASASAPALTSALIFSARFRSAARCVGVEPRLRSRASRAVPASIRCRIASMVPFAAATCSGATPFKSTASGIAPVATSARMASDPLPSAAW